MNTPGSATTARSGAIETTSAAKSACPRDGRWHECSLLDRLDRAGLAPRRDSGAVAETTLSERGILVRLGSAELELFLYPDSTARAADERRLDKSDLVEAGTPYTIRHERTLIRSANLLALLKSLNDHQRERVADAITAGPPQPQPQPPSP